MSLAFAIRYVLEPWTWRTEMPAAPSIQQLLHRQGEVFCTPDGGAVLELGNVPGSSSPPRSRSSTITVAGGRALEGPHVVTQ